MVENLLNGVSQLPAPLRLSSQAEEQVNGLSRFSDGGPSKRPNTVHVAKLTSTITGADSAFLHPINFGEDQRYFAVIANGILKVYDKETGLAIPVIQPDSDSYLTPVPADPLLFLLDTYTDVEATDLSAHASDAGSAWTSLNAVTEATIRSNRIRVNPAAGNRSQYRLAYSPPQADYTVQAVVFHDGNTSEHSEVWARIPLAAVGGYAVRLSSTAVNAVLTIQRVASNGTYALLGTQYTHSTTIAGANHDLAIRVTGTTIEALLDGVVVKTVTDSTYAAAGNPGLGG
jgi:hypothetical protein